jgi:hypothetical protein
MAQGRPRDSRKEQQWRRWIVQWQQSGLSVRAFCTLHDLAQPSFYAWRRALQQRDAAASTFVPVQIVPDDEPSSSRFEVVLAGGRILRVPPGFDHAALRQLLAVLEEVRPC